MTQPPVDLDGFRKDMAEAGAEDAVPGILEAFHENAARRIAAITRAVEVGDTAEVARLGHAFKSSAAQLKAHALAQTLEALEAAGRQGDMNVVKRRFDTFKGEVDAVLKYLRSTAR